MMNRFKNILVSVDSFLEEQPALQLAVRLAKQTSAKITIVDTHRELPWIASLLMGSEATHRDIGEKKLAKLHSLAEPIEAVGINVSTALLNGKSSHAIIQEVVNGNHDLVVRTNKGVHSQRFGFFGTTSTRLLRRCPCAVWLVRSDAALSFRKVIAAIDPAPDDNSKAELSQSIVEMARSIVEWGDGELQLVHAWELFGSHLLKAHYSDPKDFENAQQIAKARVEEVLDRFLNRFNLSHAHESVHLLCDELGPGHAISQFAKTHKSDLVVMGTLARSGLSGVLIGNTVEQMIDKIECSVLAIKPEN